MGRNWCLGQAFLTRSTVGGESTGRSKKRRTGGRGQAFGKRGGSLGKRAKGMSRAYGPSQSSGRIT
jgi:hypothetical protein